MERISSSVCGSRNYSDHTSANAKENYQYVSEVQRLMTENLLQKEPRPSSETNSFTALLGLPSNQAMELLHQPESGKSPPKNSVNEIWRHGFDCNPTFPSNKGLVERAARFSIFAAAEDHSSETSYVDPSNSSENFPKLKSEPADYESNPSSPKLASYCNVKQKSSKRKEREKKVKISAKRSKDVEKTTDGEKVPYVHVRARRGQATDSHSLAERARREKINARMKLLQELVPGCNKISGTALVLDEIINHVQSLQRQVELLSMRLAAVNPRVDISFDNFLPSEGGCLTVGVRTFPSMVKSSIWHELQGSNATGGHQYPNQNQQQLWQHDVLRPPTWERDENHNFITSPEDSVFSHNSSMNSVNLQANQLKMEI